MFDIVRDYTAISMGSAQATTARVVGTTHSGVRWATGWAHPALAGDPSSARSDLIGSVVGAPGAVGRRVQDEVDRAIARLGLVSEAEVRALRHQVQRLERHIGDLRGDR